MQSRMETGIDWSEGIFIGELKTYWVLKYDWTQTFRPSFWCIDKAHLMYKAHSIPRILIFFTNLEILFT
jgi:hypothetical protein